MDDLSKMEQRLFAADLKKLDGVADDFARAMKSKLHHKAIQGFHGWDDPTMYGDLRLKIMSLVEHLFNRDEPQEIDIANMAMMLWFQRERGSSDSARSDPERKTDG